MRQRIWLHVSQHFARRRCRASTTSVIECFATQSRISEDMRLLLASFLPTSFQRVPGFFPRSGPGLGGLGRSGSLATWSPGPRVPWPPVPWSPGPRSLVPWSPLLVFCQAIKKLQCARSCFACALLNGAVQASRSGYVWGGGGGRGRQSCTVVVAVVVAAAVVVVGSSSCRCQA